MSDPVKRFLEVASTQDDEIDAISLCVEAILVIAPASSRTRVAKYIFDRFVTENETSK